MVLDDFYIKMDDFFIVAIKELLNLWHQLKKRNKPNNHSPN